jgi:glycosyltransferase involved in cell wall biosynthesis
MPTDGRAIRAARRNAPALSATRALSNSAITEGALKILYISQYFPPEMGAPAARVSELSHHWAVAGHDVTVLTGFPNHPDGKLRPEYRKHFRRLVFRECAENVNVVRSWLLPFPNRKAHERMLNYTSFCLSAAVTGSFLGQPDLVIATSPQLLVGLSGWWVAKIKHVPFVLEVRDLWPESLAAVGAGNANSFLYRILHKIAGFLYRKASHIVVVTPAFRDHLIRHWRVPPEKISVVHNGVETTLFCPGTSESIRKSLSIENKFVVSYIGTMGMAHGLETMLEAAERLQTSAPEVLFLLVGEGADRERIQAIAEAKRLTNIRFVAQQPREKIPLYISASDVCLVLLKKSGVFDTVIPTKMLEFMSCAKPVVLGVSGQARRILEASRAGLCIEPENPEALCDAIERLRTQDYLRQSLGQNGRQYILHNLSRERTAVDYLNVLLGVLDSRANTKKAAA